MRLPYYLSFLLLFLLNFSFSQQEKYLDSLFSVWSDETNSDFNRSNAFNDYIWDGYLYSDPKKALELAQELLIFSEKLNAKGIIAAALNTQGMAYYLIGEGKMAIDKHLESKKFQEEINNQIGVANSYNNIGIVYSSLSNNIKAIEYYKKGLQIHQSIENKSGIADAHNNLGILYKSLGDNDKALEYYQKCLVIRNELNDKLGIGDVLNNIGNIYNSKKEFDKAINYYNKSIVNCDAINNKYGKANSLNNIGDIYYQKLDFDLSLEYCLMSLKLREEIFDKAGVAFSLKGIGMIYAEMGNYRKSIDYCNKALKIATELGDPFEQKSCCNCLYVNYKIIGNGNEALRYHEKMVQFDTELKKEMTAKKLQKMEFEKEVLTDSLQQVEKDLKVEMAHQEEVQKKDRNKNLALASGIFFLFLSGGLYGRWRFVKKSKSIIEKEKDRSESLLLNILPSEIAAELKAKGSADARDFDMVSILFTDFKGFTQASEKMSAKELIEEINICFKTFDHICESYEIEKIKTIGDAYMAAGGLPVPSEAAAKDTVLAALEMQKFIRDRYEEKSSKNETAFKMRVGIHTGPVVAGIVGVKKFQYDIWGDTVNTASRIESSGAIDKVNISETTYNLIKDEPNLRFEKRGKVKAKGKGEIEMFFVTKL